MAGEDRIRSSVGRKAKEGRNRRDSFGERRKREREMYFGDDHWLSFLKRLKRNLLGKFP